MYRKTSRGARMLLPPFLLIASLLLLLPQKAAADVCLAVEADPTGTATATLPGGSTDLCFVADGDYTVTLIPNPPSKVVGATLDGAPVSVKSGGGPVNATLAITGADSWGTLLLVIKTSGIGTPTTSYTVTASCTPSAGGRVEPASATVAAGEQAQFTFSPVGPYLMQDLLVNGQSVGAPPGGIYTTPSLYGDTTLQGIFTRAYQVTASFSPAGYGSVTPAGTNSFIEGATPTFTMTPRAGYGIRSVTVNQVPAADWTPGSLTYTFPPLHDNYALEVTFDLAYTVTATTASRGGTITPAGLVPVVAGQEPTFTIAPASGYVVSDVQVNDVSVGAVTSYTFPAISRSQKITALFRPSGSANSYCTLPNYVSAVKPNLLFLLDNSASMGDLAYFSSDTASYCFDNTYDNSGNYVGYFDPDGVYRYDGSAGNAAGGFVEAAAISGSCNTVNLSYLCIDMFDAIPPAPRRVKRFLASGRFLNWLVTSKLDAEKLVLSGGKFDTALQMLQGESRGCQGKRFVKVAGEVDAVTFAVRGPLPDEPDFQSSFGATRIEVYDKRYDPTCRRTVSDWTSGDAAALKADTGICLGNTTEPYTFSNGVTSLVTSRAGVFNLAINDCFTSLAKGTEVPGVDIQNLEGLCSSRFYGLYGSDPSMVNASRADDGLCSGKIGHSLYNGNAIGFLGLAFQLGGKFSSSDGKKEVADYCHGVIAGQVVDPSATAYMSGTNVNIPSFILDAGVSSLGQPSSVLQARVARSVLPQGLVQQFAGRINFGALAFIDRLRDGNSQEVFYNNGGNASECVTTEGAEIRCIKSCSQNHNYECGSDTDCVLFGAGVCVADPVADGGRVLSYLAPEVGDHGFGMIGSIDGIRATSWTPLAETFYNAIGYFARRTDLRLPLPGSELAWDPAKIAASQGGCQENHVLIVSDGMSSADANPSVLALAGLYASASGAASATCPYRGNRSLNVLAWLAHNRDITSFSTATASTATPTRKSHSVTTHTVFTGTSTGDGGGCDPARLLSDTAVGGGGRYVYAPDPGTLFDSLKGVLLQITGGGNTGSDATILSTGRGNGSIFLQDSFYPHKSFDGGVSSASWIGEMQGLWYFIDSFIGAENTGQGSTVRDDAGTTKDTVHELSLSDSHVVQYFFDAEKQMTRARLFSDPSGSGVLDGASFQTVDPDRVQSIFRAGVKLWERSASDRTIYTDTDGRTLTRLADLDLSNGSLMTLLQAQDAAEAGRIVSWVTGTDQPGYRARKVAYPQLAGLGMREWKLGDLIASPPRVQSGTPLNSYHLPPPRGYADTSYGNLYGGDGFTDLASYAGRGMVYVGANDGMLHAFRLGLLSTSGSGPVPATLTGNDLGREEWAFIPKNALPYLKYLTYQSYPHLSIVDGSLTLIDASIGDPATCIRSSYFDCRKQTDKESATSSWRTILIGAMGLGGASRSREDSCSETAPDGCVKAPVAGAGLSSYFALDVTNQTFTQTGEPSSLTLSGAPRLLWELSDPELGFSSSGPAIIRIKARKSDGNPDPDRNGHWFAVFASGPTGPIDAATCQFKGASGQNLKLFVVDLNAAPPLARGSNYWVLDTGIENAFGGSLAGAGIDADKGNPGSDGFYQDDALYLGYTAKGDGTWNDGGVIRVLTMQDPDPGQWMVSKVIDGIGPVTAAVTKLQNRKNHKLWLYFGTGRSFFRQDDMSSRRALFGMQESCYTGEDTIDYRACGAALHGYDDALSDKSTDASDSLGMSGGYRGWYIKLDPADTDNQSGSERLLADPSSLTSGAVYFTTYQPSSDDCNPQGTSYLWGVKYDTGGSLASNALRGKALVRLSTGGVNEVALAGGLGDKGGRRGGPMPGRPGGVKIITNSGLRPAKKILHIQER